MTKKVYLSPPELGGRELELVEDAIKSNWIAPLGPHVDAFEGECAAACGVAHGAATNSGTAALHLALRLVGVEPDSTVLCSDLTFCASATPIRYLGARPVFVDSEPSSWCMDPALLEQALEELTGRGEKVAAVVVVDLYGQVADYSRIEEICRTYGVPVVEDAAEALGASLGDRAAGSFGRCSILSFNGNKIITTSGGGMLLSNDEDMIERARFLASQAREPVAHYEHRELGYNYRLSNLLAAVGRAQLEGLEAKVDSRRRVFERYSGHLGSLPGFAMMPEAADSRSSRWLTCLTIDPAEAGTSRDAVIGCLSSHQIEARPVWKPMHLQPLFHDCPVYGGEVGKRLFERGLCLPSGGALSDETVDEICRLVRSTIS